MQKNFLGRKLHDTVYVTANPYAERLPKDVFYTIENVLDHWNEEYETVLPSEVVTAASDTHKKYPNKRLIVHFMQPHEPWIGPTMKNIRKRINLAGYDKEYAQENENGNIDGINPWQAVRLGIVDLEEMKQAYRESLDIVLQEVEVLITNIEGNTVITSDHGEYLGDKLCPLGPRLYGHPHTIYSKKLCKVPWHVISSNSRRETIVEEPEGYQRLSEDTLNDRLQSLGYAPE
jgi:lipopolysaccharide biosynthesis glycosyltransferase